MQAERVQVLVQQAAAGNVEAFVALVQEFAPNLRVLLAAHLDQPAALIPVEAMVWSTVRTRLGEWLPDTPFSQWLMQMAIAPVTTHLVQADRRAIDVQDALSHQLIEQCRQALDDGSELQVQELSARFAAQPEATRTLLIRRYRERQRPSALAASLMISEPELATTLAAARAACDWQGLAKPPGPNDRLVPPLIEDWLNGTIDVDSRSLLATNLARDPERALQFTRQVRVHLALGAALAPFTREDAVAITRQAGQGAGDSGRVMMGDHPRASSGLRPPASDARRPRMTTSNRQVVPLEADTPRPSPLPWIIGGGMVLVGIFALVVVSLGGGSRAAAPRPHEPTPASTSVVPAGTPAPTSTTTTASTPERSAPASGGILRLDPGRTNAPPPPPPRIALSGPAITGRAYVGQPCDLRAELSHTYGVTSVEFWNGNQRVASLSQEPFVWTWDKPEVGTASFTARALGPVGVLSTSAPAPVTVTQSFGTGSIRREWWTGIGGDQLTQGYAVAGYPDQPQGADEVRNFATPRNVNDNYLQRVRGFIVPPVDGEYVFWVAGDDESELWLSEDDTRSRLRRIAASPMSIAPEEWEGRPSQRSAPIALVKGRRYYVEALHKEGGGDDHVAVGWRLPDGTLERPIPGAHLAPPTEPVVASAPPRASETPAVQAPVTILEDARRPDLMIWDGEGAKGGAGYKGFGSGGQSPLEVAPGQGRLGAGLRARLGGGNGANVGWNWHSWASDDAGTDLRGFAAITMWVRFTGGAAPRKMVMRLSCSPREPVRRTVDIELVARQPRLMDGAWHQVVVPLAELAPQGHQFDRAKAWEVSFDISSTANMEGSIDIDEIGAVRSLVAPPPTLAPTWKVVRAINLGGETTEIDGVRFLGHRQAEAEGATPAGSHQPGPWLDEIAWARANNANGEVKRNKNWSDKPLSIDGKVYAHGLGTHAASEVIYALDGRYSGFTAVVGIDDASEPGDAIFQVWVDGQKAFDSGAMRRGTAKPVAVPLAGRKELRLVVDPNGNNDWDHANWGNAQMLVPGGNDGVLQVQAGRRATAMFVPKPAVDAKTRALLGTALGATKEGLAFRVKVSNGLYRVWLWVAENGAANSRQFDLTVEGQTLTGVGLLPANSWDKLGPIEVTVVDGTINVAATVIKGIPQVMGIAIFENATSATSPNLLPNFGFENGPAPWRYEGSAACVNTGAHVGGFAGQATESNVGINQQIGGLQVNTTYTLTAWGRISGVDDVAYIYAENYGGEERQSAFTSTAGYMQSSLTFTTGATNTSVEVGFWKKAGTGSAWVDDFSLTANPAAGIP